MDLIHDRYVIHLLRALIWRFWCLMDANPETNKYDISLVTKPARLTHVVGLNESRMSLLHFSMLTIALFGHISEHAFSVSYFINEVLTWSLKTSFEICAGTTQNTFYCYVNNILSIKRDFKASLSLMIQTICNEIFLYFCSVVISNLNCLKISDILTAFAIKLEQYVLFSVFFHKN